MNQGKSESEALRAPALSPTARPENTMADAATEKQALTQVRALELEQQFWW